MLNTIEQFREHLSAFANRVEPHLAHPSAEGMAELDRTRCEMSRILSTYNLFVHREIFTPMLEIGNDAEVSAAQGMKVESICLTEEFRTFTAKWRTADTGSEWESFRPDACAFRSRLTAHIEQVTAMAALRLAHSTAA